MIFKKIEFIMNVQIEKKKENELNNRVKLYNKE